MIIHKAYSTSTAKLNWRTQIKQNQLVSQISSILLQRNNWVPLLQNLNLSSKLTPFLFLQILHKIQTNPRTSLNFFNWASANLNFSPDLKSQLYVIQISLGSGLSQPAKKILDSLIQNHPVNEFLEAFVQACRGKRSQLYILDFVLEFYSHKGLFVDGLEVYKKMRVIGSMPSVQASNALLDALQKENEIKLAWRFYCSMIRVGVFPDKLTWSIVAHILCKGGNFDRIVRLLDIGICNSVMYNAVVDWYSKNGDFEAAVSRLNEMCDRKVEPGFSTYSSILDGACKFRNAGVIKRVMALMVDKELLSKRPVSDNDVIIQKLCDLGKVNAATMFLNRACDERIRLQDATYGCMLRAFSKEGIFEEAVRFYHLISERGLAIKNNAFDAFVNLLCAKDEYAEGYEILVSIMKKGFSPCTSSLSKFVASLCKKCRWKEADGLVFVALEKQILVDSSSFSSLVKHYCFSRQIDRAVALHDTLEKLRACLDITTYNVLVDGLVKQRRVEESIRVFEYMKELKLANSSSFTVIIRGLCRAKELRKAMNYHDEMLNMGLEPDKPTYKRLILEFEQ